MLWNHIEVVVLQHWECTKCYQIVLFKMENFLCDFHSNKEQKQI